MRVGPKPRYKAKRPPSFFITSSAHCSMPFCTLDGRLCLVRTKSSGYVTNTDTMPAIAPESSRPDVEFLRSTLCIYQSVQCRNLFAALVHGVLDGRVGDDAGDVGGVAFEQGHPAFVVHLLGQKMRDRHGRSGGHLQEYLGAL